MTSTLEKFAQLLANIVSAEVKAERLHAQISSRKANEDMRIVRNYLKRAKKKENEAYRNYKEGK